MKNILIPMFAATLLAGPAMANTKTSKTFSGWQVECVENDKTKVKNCVMSQTLINQKTKQRVVSVLVRKPKDEPYKLILQVPLGADLSAGVGLTIDTSAPVKVAYKTCMPKTCIAEFELTEAWAKALSGGTNATITVTGLKGESVPFKIALKGFTDAYAWFAAEAP